MPDKIAPHVAAHAQNGQPTWYPSPGDDTPPQPVQRSGIQRIFYGTDGLRAGWSLLLYVALVAALAAGVANGLDRAGMLHRPSAHGPRLEQRAMPVILQEGGQFLAVALAAYAMTFVERRRFAAYGMGSFFRRAGQFASGWLLGAATLSALVGVLWWRHLLALDGITMHGAPVVEWGLVWFLSFLAVGLFEEYLSRGYVQFTLARGLAGIAGALGMAEGSRRAIGFWLAALFMSFLFGLGHTSNAGESPIGLLSAGLIGLLFAFTLWRTGSLWFAIGWHAAWDWAESFLWSVPDSGIMVQHHLTNATPQGPVLWSGGLTGPEGSWLVLPVIACSAALFALVLKPEPGSPSVEFRQQ